MSVLAWQLLILMPTLIILVISRRGETITNYMKHTHIHMCKHIFRFASCRTEMKHKCQHRNVVCHRQTDIRTAAWKDCAAAPLECLEHNTELSLQANSTHSDEVWSALRRQGAESICCFCTNVIWLQQHNCQLPGGSLGMLCCMQCSSAPMLTPNKLESMIIVYACNILVHMYVRRRACLSFIAPWVASTPAHLRRNC